MESSRNSSFFFRGVDVIPALMKTWIKLPALTPLRSGVQIIADACVLWLPWQLRMHLARCRKKFVSGYRKRVTRAPRLMTPRSRASLISKTCQKLLWGAGSNSLCACRSFAFDCPQIPHAWSRASQPNGSRVSPARWCHRPRNNHQK